ncbi:MAG: hypothetical protein JWL80_419 [Parcubacteria group bacterium]|nr:hypothetical protein [Parcubacteria group bacterium]
MALYMQSRTFEECPMGSSLSDLCQPVRMFPPGTLMVEPVDDAAHQLLASHFPEELREDDVVIMHNMPPEAVLWKVDEKILIFLRRYPHSIRYRVYEACPAGLLVRRHR